MSKSSVPDIFLLFLVSASPSPSIAVFHFLHVTTLRSFFRSGLLASSFQLELYLQPLPQDAIRRLGRAPLPIRPRRPGAP